MDEIRIRKITKEDASAIARISAAITQTPEQINYAKIAENESLRKSASSLVAESDGKVVGYIICYILSGLFGIEKSAWIVMVGVDPKYMDKGIGKKLALEIFAILKSRGITNVFTSVPWDSTDLLSFFKSLGFGRSSFINLGRPLD